MHRNIYRPARSLSQLLCPVINVRSLASRRATRAAKVWPRPAYDSEPGHQLSRDPEILVRSVHEKERNAFRSALEDKDFVTAYQIYIEQRELPILNGAEVTSLVQLISADALLRDLNGYEQPQSLKDVFWTIIEDVKEHKVAGQMMLWHHALETLITWGNPDEAQELWSYLKDLPNRVAVDKNDAACIDSRVYGAAIKLYTALGDFAKAEQLYTEALDERKLRPSLMINQALISSLFQNGQIGKAYKLMDDSIREHRGALRPGFFNSMIALALQAKAVGVASEIFMKACKINMPPSDSQVTRLLSALARTRTDPLGSVLTIFKHYRQTSGEKLPIEHVNCVIRAIFASADSDVPTKEVLSRVHKLLKETQSSGLRSSASTVNILLAGYLDLGEHQLMQNLLGRADLNENSFRSILKSLAHSKAPDAYAKTQDIWSIFEQHRRDRGTQFVARDLLMLMRAAFATDEEAARTWVPATINRYYEYLRVEEQTVVSDELTKHENGRFVQSLRHQANKVYQPDGDTRTRKWLTTEDTPNIVETPSAKVEP